MYRNHGLTQGPWRKEKQNAGTPQRKSEKKLFISPLLVNRVLINGRIIQHYRFMKMRTSSSELKEIRCTWICNSKKIDLLFKLQNIIGEHTVSNVSSTSIIMIRGICKKIIPRDLKLLYRYNREEQRYSVSTMQWRDYLRRDICIKSHIKNKCVFLHVRQTWQ